MSIYDRRWGLKKSLHTVSLSPTCLVEIRLIPALQPVLKIVILVHEWGDSLESMFAIVEASKLMRPIATVVGSKKRPRIDLRPIIVIYDVNFRWIISVRVLVLVFF